MLDLSFFPLQETLGQLTQPIWRFLGDFQTVQNLGETPWKHLGPWRISFFLEDDSTFPTFGMGKELPIFQANLLLVFGGCKPPGNLT